MRAHGRVFAFCVTTAVLAFVGIARAQVPVQVLHEFSGYEESVGPTAPLIQATDGDFYGTTQQGGAFNSGTIFKMTASGAVTLLHSFAGGAGDGKSPSGALVQGADGNFYGTTALGGASAGCNADACGRGTIFRMTPAGRVDILYSFGSEPDGAFPQSALIQAADGNFYGTTLGGGILNHGTLFRTTPAGAVTILHRFGGGPSDGDHPYDALVQASDGNFYGTTSDGGGSGRGTIFRMTPDGTVAILHAFRGEPGDGAKPLGALIQASDGNLYGTTAFGGGGLCASCRSGAGTVFKATLAGAITILHAFNDDVNIAQPRGPLVQATDGTFYGTTVGSLSGTVFRITATGTFTLLHMFAGGADGAQPSAGLIQASDGRLYGTTERGGCADFGTLFSITAAGAVTILHQFSGSAEGIGPAGPVVQASDGNFYGTTYYGGACNRGTIFRVTPGGTYTLLHTFAGGLDGGYPHGSLVQGRDGRLYGITSRNGTYDAGTTFRIALDGQFAKLHSFAGEADGSFPAAGLIQGGDGDFYGTTSYGGAFNRGTGFRMAPDGTTVILHAFAGGQDGANPAAPLIQTADGSLYGTTRWGGGTTGYNFYSGAGTVFRVTAAGDYVVLHRFDIVHDGGGPNAGLVRGTDGNLYGTSSCASNLDGGPPPGGAFFRMSPSGLFTVLGRNGFQCDDDLGDPVITLTSGHGTFYGTISGTVFAMTESGVRKTLCASPKCRAYSPVIQANDGNLYGDTSRDGTYGAGTVFRLRPWRASAGDFTGDRVSDLAQFRASTGVWHVADSNTGYTTSVAQPFGQPGDLPVPADYDGDGTNDLAVYRRAEGNWYIRDSSDDAVRILSLGVSTDVPVPGDYDADGKTDPAVFRPSTGQWLVLLSSQSYHPASFALGLSTDIAIPGDYDGDGFTDLAVYRPSTGLWYVRESSTGYNTSTTFRWGLSGDEPVPADYDGDGKVDPSVYRPSTGVWYILQSSTGYTSSLARAWGLSGDLPVPGDYDGDGAADIAAYRPASGTWFILTSTSGFATSRMFVWGWTAICRCRTSSWPMR